MAELEIVYKKIGTLKRYKKNSRTHSKEQIQQIAASINEFGFTNPILIKKQQIISGHGRLEAAKLVGLKTLPTISLSRLSDDQMKALVIADNQLALNAGWDLDLLKSEIEELKLAEFDIDLLGFDDSFINETLDLVDFDFGLESEQGELDSLDPKYIKCPKCGSEFDTRDSS